MTRLTIALLLSAAGTALAQFPPPTGSPFPQPPTFGNGVQQSPISPYLNLLNNNGSNPAVNYYNFARPLLQQQQQVSPFAPPFVGQPGAFPQQMGYLPPGVPFVASEQPFTPTGNGSLPPTGHPVVYGNRFGQASSGGGRTGYFPPAPGQQPSAAPQSIPRSK